MTPRGGRSARRRGGVAGRSDRGSVTVAAGAIVLLCLLGLTSVLFGAAVDARARAQTAADAAALAAAAATFARFGPDRSPTEAAARLAADNGAVLLACACAVDRSWAPRTVVVRVAVEGPTVGAVSVGRLTAEAAAELRPVALLTPSRDMAPSTARRR